MLGAYARRALAIAARRARRAGAATTPSPSLQPTVQQERSAWVDSRGVTHFGSGPGAGPGGLSKEALRALAVTGGIGGVVLYSYSEKVPLTGRRHLVFLSEATEKQLGRRAFEEIRSEHAAALLPPHSSEARRVARISRRILDAAADPALGLRQLPQLSNVRWEFVVVDSPQLNAFCVPDGKVVVFTGLLRLLRARAAPLLREEHAPSAAPDQQYPPAQDDNELAAVLAHEIGHVVARHSAEKVSTSVVAGLLSLLLSAAAGGGNFGGVTTLGLSLPFSRIMETEADAIGLRLMTAACFDPAAAPRVFEKMHAAHGHARAPPEWLSTHPSDAKRVEALRGAGPAARKVYEEKCGAAAAWGGGGSAAAWRGGLT